MHRPDRPATGNDPSVTLVASKGQPVPVVPVTPVRESRPERRKKLIPASLTDDSDSTPNNQRLSRRRWLHREIDSHCEKRMLPATLRDFAVPSMLDFGVAISADRDAPGRVCPDPSNRENNRFDESGAEMVKLVVRDRETIQEAVRRFRKLVERSGIKKEMRRREFYEKPSETNRRARIRAERRNRRTNMLSR